MSEIELGRACEAHLKHTGLSYSDKGGVRWLEVPGHTPLPSDAPAPSFAPRARSGLFYEQSTTLLLSYLFGRYKPRVFFDIGSASGYFSLLAASRNDAAIEAHAFDMRPAGKSDLDRQYARLTLPGKVHAHLSGLSDEHQGERDVWFARTQMFETEPRPEQYVEAWHRRLKFWLKGDKTRGLHKAKVLLTSLDHFSSNVAWPELIKCDVDGYEGKVLSGGKALFSSDRAPLLLLELHRDAMQRDGFNRQTAVAPLFASNYKALFLTDHHDATKCAILPAGPEHELFQRQETDMVLFVPPRIASVA
jgi:FkbM family methyltransferase